ncbi:MAG: MgtC/SapB family protein [Alphaproteobacteria bacterium]|nr:MgtC/SapB family protein [Alphaproteobacteria bacterium]
MSGFTDFTGQGWLQLGELALAFGLSALVGAEREIRQKSAGLRTHTLVGVSAALIMLISKYGFMDILSNNRIVLDPSRVAAQVVSGIGFIGGGVIFMRRDVVRGLTTAASVWFTAALGMACGAGLPVLAVATTVGHFIIMLVFPQLVRHFPHQQRTTTNVRISYEDGRGLLRTILLSCSDLRFTIGRVQLAQGVKSAAAQAAGPGESGAKPARFVALNLQVKGRRPISQLVTALSGIDGVREVVTTPSEKHEE